MSSTLNRKQGADNTGGERYDEISTTGTLRRAAAIPVVEEDTALSPLKQLQRLNQVTGYPTIRKKPVLSLDSKGRSNFSDKSSTSSASSSSSDVLPRTNGANSTVNSDSSTEKDPNDNLYNSVPQHSQMKKSDTNGNMPDLSSSNVVSPSLKYVASPPSNNVTSPPPGGVTRADVLVTPSSEQKTHFHFEKRVPCAVQQESGIQPDSDDIRVKQSDTDTGDDDHSLNDRHFSSFKDTEKCFCPLALDLHPHTDHPIDFTNQKTGRCSPDKKQELPQKSGNVQQVVVEVHRTESEETINNNNKTEVSSETHQTSESKVSQDQTRQRDRNHSVTKPPASHYHVEQHSVQIEAENVYDIPRSTPVTTAKSNDPANPSISSASQGVPGMTTHNAPQPLQTINLPNGVQGSAKSPTRAVRSQRPRGRSISRPKCKAPPPPTSARTIRDSLCSSTLSVNSSASSSHSGSSNAGSMQSGASNSSGISSSGSALSQCSQSTLTSNEVNRTYIISEDVQPYTRPMGPPPPLNKKPTRPPPLIKMQQRAVSEPREALRSQEVGQMIMVSPCLVTSPQYDVSRKVLNDRPKSQAAPKSIYHDNDLEAKVISPTAGEVTSFLPTSKPVIDVKLIKHEKTRSPKPTVKVLPCTEEMNNINRMTRSAEDLDQKYIELIELGPTRPISPMVRNSFMGSDVEIPREEVYNSMGEMNTLLKTTAPDAEKIYSLPQPQCYGEETLKAVKAITEKYDTLERHRQRTVSFRDNARTSVSSGTRSEPTSPMITIHEVSASDPQLNDVTDSVFNEAHSISKGLIKTEVAASPDKILDMTYGGINARDISRIDLFYRGRGTEVVVCTCMASLSVGIPSPVTDEIESWGSPIHVGVPVFVLNTGTGNRRRELFVIIAERETGFPLWQDKVSYLTNYHQMSPLVHMLQPSMNLRQKVSITFLQEHAAQDFFDKFQEITTDPNDELWKISSGKEEKKHRKITFRKKKTAKKDYNKTEISKPCNFSHLTNIDPRDCKMVQELSAHKYSLHTGSEEEMKKQKTKTM